MASLHFSQLIHPDDHNEVVKNFNDRLAGTCEFKIITKTGREKHISYSGTSIKKEGRIIGLQAIIRDITKTKELQENIKQAKEHYEQVIDAIQDGICVIGKDFKIVSCNKTFAKKINLPITEIKGKKCQDVIPHYENNLFKNHCHRRSNKGKCIPTMAFLAGENISATEKNIDEEGNIHYHRMRAFPSKNEAGEVEQVVLVIKNITEYQKAEEEIRRLSEFNKKILDNVPVSIITINKDEVVTSVNDFFYALAGENNLVGENIFSRPFFKKENLVKKYKKLLKTGESFSKSNCKTINSQGEIKYLNIIATPVRNKKGEIEGAISMALDNTEAILKEQEIAKLNINLEKKVSKRTQQLNDINKELQKILELKSKFISDASHELRTPLTIMQGNLDLAIKENNARGEAIPEAFNLINKEIGQISGILSDLTMLTNTDSDAEKINYEKINLASLIKAVEESLKILAKHKKIKVLNNKTKKTINIMGDEAKLEKLLLNIVSNAIKYTKEGGVVKIQAEKNDNNIKIIVEDNGIGIPGEDLPYIFERFYRADKARSNAEGGTGLGLSIAKWIAEAHYGKIDVESTLGKGSKFTIDLPYDYKKQKEEISLF